MLEGCNLREGRLPVGSSACALRPSARTARERIAYRKPQIVAGTRHRKLRLRHARIIVFTEPWKSVRGPLVATLERHGWAVPYLSLSL